MRRVMGLVDLKDKMESFAYLVYDAFMQLDLRIPVVTYFQHSFQADDSKFKMAKGYNVHKAV